MCRQIRDARWLNVCNGIVASRCNRWLNNPERISIGSARRRLLSTSVRVGGAADYR